MRAVLSALVFPTVFGGALTVTWALLHADVARPLVVALVMAAAALAVTILERLLPFEPAWSRSHGDLKTDLVYATVSLFAAPRLFDAVLLSAMVAAGDWLTGQLGSHLWPAALPWAAQVALAVVIAEFGSYWWHRLMHERPLLFRLHATHHSAPRLYWLNSTRFHPLDDVVMYGLQLLPLMLLGAPTDVLVGFTVWSLVHGFFQHANVDVKLGPLNWCFSMAELHRWHHSRVVDEANHNYGSNTCVWDLVFGTFYLPRDRRPPVAVGLSDHDAFPQTIGRQLLSPLWWPSGRPASGSERPGLSGP